MGEEDQFAFTEQRKSLYDVNTDLLTRVKCTGCTVGLEIHRIKDRTTDTSWWCSGGSVTSLIPPSVRPQDN